MRRNFFLILLHILSVAWATACAPEGGSGFEQIWANRVVAYHPVRPTGVTEADWPYFFHPENALGPPGDAFGVVSLGYNPSLSDTLGGSLTLGLGVADDPARTHCIEDGAGEDFVVYENPFYSNDPNSGLTVSNVEAALVSVSEDGVTFFTFPVSIDDTFPLGDARRTRGFAGKTPVGDGGDRFDLADLIQVHALAGGYRACFVRLTDGGTRYQDYGNTQTDAWSSGADINAVEVIHPVEAGTSSF